MISRATRRARATIVLVAIVVALAGCANELVATPLGPCGDDARAPGGFPELEVLLPAALPAGGRAPDGVDSGRSCSEAALGTLKSHGVTELRFAGATWREGDSDGTVIAVLATPGGVPLLDEAWVEEFYEAGAAAGKKTDNIETSQPTMDGAGAVFRIDTLNDLSFQTVVTWQTAGLTHVVIVATDVSPTADRAAHDRRVGTAVATAAAAFGAASSNPPALPPSSMVLPSRA